MSSVSPSLSSQPLPLSTARLSNSWVLSVPWFTKGNFILHFLRKGPQPQAEASAPLSRALENKVCNKKMNGAFLVFMACVFLIIFWTQSLAFVPKPHEAGYCFSQSKETSPGLMPCIVVCSQSPLPSTPGAQLCFHLLHRPPALLLLCWQVPPPLPPFPPVFLMHCSKIWSSWSKILIILQNCSIIWRSSVLLT